MTAQGRLRRTTSTRGSRGLLAHLQKLEIWTSTGGEFREVSVQVIPTSSTPWTRDKYKPVPRSGSVSSWLLCINLFRTPPGYPNCPTLAEKQRGGIKLPQSDGQTASLRRSSITTAHATPSANDGSI
jgi:hypothetical protein